MGCYNILFVCILATAKLFSVVKCCIAVNYIDFPSNDFLIIRLFANLLLSSFCIFSVVFLYFCEAAGTFLWSQQVADERGGEILKKNYSRFRIVYKNEIFFPIIPLDMLGHVKLESQVKGRDWYYIILKTRSP